MFCGYKSHAFSVCYLSGVLVFIACVKKSCGHLLENSWLVNL
jgi:hypothetical protein